MPQVIAAIIVYFIPSAGAYGLALAGTTIAVSYATIAATVITAVGTAAYANAQRKKLGRQLAGLRDQAGITASFTEATASHKLVFGEVRMGGNPIYAQKTGAKGEYLHIVMPFAEAGVWEIGNTFFGDEDLGNPWGSGDVPDVTSRFYGKARIKKHRGETGVADSDLVAESGGKWTSDHKMLGAAYLYVRLEFDVDVFTAGIPQISTMVKGYKLYDPRDASEDWNSNPALVARWYLVNEVGVDPADINDASVIAAANICDESVTIADASTEARYSFNGVLDTAVKWGDNLDVIAATMAGSIYESGGMWYIDAGAHKSSSGTIDISHLRGPISIQTKDSIRDTCNGVRSVYYSPANNWQLVDAPAYTKRVTAPNITAGARCSIVSVGSTDFTLIGSADNNVGTIFTASGAGTGTGEVDPYLGEDGDRYWLDADYPGVITESHATRLNRIKLEMARQDIAFAAPLKLHGLRYKVGDTVAVNLAENGWSGKLFTITKLDISSDMVDGVPLLGVDAVFRETSSDIWSRTAAEETTADSAPNTDLPTPWIVEPPTNLALTSGTAQLIVGTDGTIISRILVEWDEPADQFVTSGGLIEVQYKLSSDSTWSPGGYVNGSDIHTYIPGVFDGEDYDVRVRSNNRLASSAWVTESNHTVAGKTTAPAAPSSLTATGLAGTILAEWDNPSDVDLAANTIWTNSSASFPGGAGKTIPAIPGGKGTYRVENQSGGTTVYVWVGTVDTSGNVSATNAGPANATATSGTAGTDGYWGEINEVNSVQCDSAGTAKAGELGGSGRVRSIFAHFRGTTGLTATGSTPGAGQFRVVKIADTNCTTTYSGGYVIELTTISAASGYTEYKIELEGTSTYVQSKYHWNKTLDGTAGTPGVSPPGFWATSSSSVTIGTGSKVFNIGAGYGYFAGMRARAIDQANSANWVEGLITGYSSSNLTINVDLISGSGTKTAWNIGIAGVVGATGSTGPTGSAGSNGTNGTNGTNGAAGAAGNYLVRIYKSSATVPSTPSAVNSPSGWTTTVPAVVANQATYVSEAYFDGATNNLIGTWSTPARLPGNLTFYATAFPTGIIATGDYCFRTDLENELYRYNGSTWDQISQKVYADDFGTGVRPVQLVSSNPALPNSAYPTGSVILNSTDGKLYRNNSGAWTAATPTSDLTGTIAAGQIAANAVTAGTIAANAVTAGTIAAGVVTATTVGTNQIIASSANVANAVITNAHIVTIDAGKLTAGTINAVLSLTTGGEFRAGTGDSQLAASTTGTTIGNTSGQHIAAITFTSGTTRLEARRGSTAYATFGAYSLGSGIYAGQITVSSSLGPQAVLNPLSLVLGSSSITETSALTLRTDAALICTGTGIAQLDATASYSEFVATKGVAVDVQGVNFRVFDSGGTQKARIDNTNGDIYLASGAKIYIGGVLKVS